MKNLGRIDSGRVFLWMLLSLSSIPLHLLCVISAHWFYICLSNSFFFRYNSCVFSTISASAYNVNVTTYNMFENSPAFLNATWVNLTNSECISGFGHQLVSSWAEVVVIVIADTNETALAASNPYAVPSPYDLTPISSSWMCNDQFQSCHPNANSWSLTIDGGSSASVVGCYAKPAVQHCKLQFIPSLTAVVIVCNAAKAICISISFWRKSWSRSLVTVGGMPLILPMGT